jgi:addiction module HigA family antidote
LKTCEHFAANRLEALSGSRKGQSAFGSMTNFESASNGKRKDRLMSKSSITTEKKLPPIHPGRILLEDLKDEQIGINGLAQAIRVPANRISLIVNEKRGITADTAARLGRYFGTSTQYWLNIRNRFDLDFIDWAVIERDVIPKQAA